MKYVSGGENPPQTRVSGGGPLTSQVSLKGDNQLKFLIINLMITNGIMALCYGFQGNYLKLIWHLFLCWMGVKGVD